MAFTNNPVLQGARGRVGALVFRQFRGRTVVSARPKPDKSLPSAAKQATRANFRDAAAYSQKCMKVPDLKAYYLERAQTLGLPNAYTAALTDYMRKGSIESVDRSGYTGKANEAIGVTVRKKGFSVKEVTVSLTTNAGMLIERGSATEKTPGMWIYTTTAVVPDARDVVLTATAVDTDGKLLT
jgi:hypothetical protein